jgi:subtilase family serine protease
MELQRRHRIGSRYATRIFWMIAVLAVCGGIVMAQESSPIVGDHVSNAAFTSELADGQPLQLQVIMALNNRAQLTQLEADIQDRDSPSYHRWLTPQQFAASFGPTSQQMRAVATWLRSRGLMVGAMDRQARTVRFAGLYWQVKQALGTTILGDGINYANVTDPQVPAELAPTIVSIEGLRTHTEARRKPTATLLLAPAQNLRNATPALISAPAISTPFMMRLRCSMAATSALAAPPRQATASRYPKMPASTR